ncbi:MFS transporter [Bacillus luteolus]|uniref:MFS transporter n=1 Tax=Litchfieldia luteola TaxID=682179 RepID=A0ABR9QLI0_9BACI|nr:MFS transporter [Cytobacillus luteolus]MBE4909059.1 MFS transporter [Cytobacillus luteolus]MBP1941915.1 MFS family permease [Cytobacillus luteolus]
MNQTSKKNSLLLLFGIGTSTFGDFIYLIAINILVLQVTNSAAAVAGLWIMGPIASILTKFWSGSVIDRSNKRNLMIASDIFRALLVAIIPFLTSIWLIYACLFFLSVARAFFEPTSMTYITKLIPQEQRKKFNSYRSLVTSGAFLVGPAIAGVLLIISSAKVAIWINAVTFIVSAIILFLLPNLEKNNSISHGNALSLTNLKQDWRHVLTFSKNSKYIVTIYAIAQFIMVIALGMDAQEVVFTQKVLGLSEADFGYLISITGIGHIIGSLTVSVFSKRLSIQQLMGIGYLMVAIGYLIYALSFSFTSVAVGFIILGYFNAFYNTGFMTFVQNNVPTDMMGRILSVFGTFQSFLQIALILLIGFTGEILELRYTIIIASVLNMVVSLALILLVYRPSRAIYFKETNELSN